MAEWDPPGAVFGGPDGLALPERMAPVNALLDLASPPLREQLMIAFLDRLTRTGQRRSSSST